jgi:hypothetical protein
MYPTEIITVYSLPINVLDINNNVIVTLKLSLKGVPVALVAGHMFLGSKALIQSFHCHTPDMVRVSLHQLKQHQ